jgi:hypothetical protein
LQGLAPSVLRMMQRPEGLAGLHEEDMLVIDFPGGHEGFSKTEVPSENGQRARTQLNAAILTRLRFIPINAGDSGLVDADDSLNKVECQRARGQSARTVSGR